MPKSVCVASSRLGYYIAMADVMMVLVFVVVFFFSSFFVIQREVFICLFVMRGTY